MMLDLFRMKYGYHNAKVLVKSGGDLEKNKHLISDSARFSLEELLEVCHRILIMKEGKIIGEVRPEDININQLYALSMGDEQV